MAVQTHFIKFHNKIKLTRESVDYRDAREKDSSILSQVRTAFCSAGYPIIDDFLQGSFSTNTAIQSLDGDFDIDRAVVVDFDKAPDDPVTAKRKVKEVLDNRGFRNAKIKNPCVTADYASLNLHIDIPIYAKSGESYKLALGKANSTSVNRKWSDSDPKGLRNWINDTSSYTTSPNDTQQQFIRLVRYIKRWRDHKFSADVRRKVYSIGLTVIIKQCFQPCFDQEGKPDDLRALKETVDRILSSGYFYLVGVSKYKISVLLPVTPRMDIFANSSSDTGTQLQNKFVNLQTKLGEVQSEVDEGKQCEILNKLFGDDFEVPENSSGAKNSLAAFSSAGVVGTSQGA
ncbi:nucleotidyltransferase [Vibrio harveyi]|uniref:nucleotidyltransferase n=1 Tax=Vibrio harveyi TaxID=669 RepID=UPI0030F5E082